MTARSSKRDDLLAILLLLILSTIVFSDVLFLGQRFYIRDLTRYYYPTKHVIREVLQSGEMPYWNRYYSAGQPMAANPEYEVWYPPQWLILLPDYDLGFNLHIVLHLHLAALGMYLLLRSMKLRIGTSIFGAMAFAFSGLYISFFNLLPILFCLAWVPLILFFYRRFLLEGRLRDFAAAAIFLGMQMLAAEPTSLAQTWFLVGCLALYHAWYDAARWRAIGRNLASTAALLVASIALGAVQLFPALDHVKESARSRPFEFKLVTAWSLPYVRAIELVFPNFFGHVTKDNISWFWASGLYPGMGSPFYFSIYFGLIALALALAAIVIRPRGGRVAIGIVAFSSLLALGGHTPLFKYLYRAGVTTIRYPEKFSFMALFVLMILAAKMFDRAVDGDRRVIRTAFAIALAATIFSLLVAVMSATPYYPGLFAKMWGYTLNANTMRMVNISRVDWWIAVARGVITIALLLVLRIKRPGRLWYSVLFTFLFVDLFFAGRDALPREPKKFFTPPEVTRNFDADRRNYRIFHEADWYGGTKIANTYFSTGDAVYWVVRNGIFPMTPTSWGLQTVLERDYDKTSLLTTVDLVDALWKVRDRGQKQWADIFMAMSNARYRGTYKAYEPERKRVGGRMKECVPIDFKRVESFGTYYFADQIETIRDDKDFVDKLVGSSWSRKIAFVATPSFAPAAGRVLRVVETPNRATIEVESSGRAFLVASVTANKFWSAAIDGKPARIERVNIGYQGIVVPQGRHLVTMAYRNTIVDAGGVVTLIAFLVLTVLAIFGRGRTAVVETSGATTESV